MPRMPPRGGYTQFGRPRFELNIDILCANSSPAKGRVERMNVTLQDRLVKELRLRGISSMEAANAYAPTFIAAFNARFAKVPKRDFDAHRPLRGDEDLARIFSWREWRKVSQSLTLQYAKVMYLIEDRPEHRRLIHRYIEVAEYRMDASSCGSRARPCSTPPMTGWVRSTRLRSSRTSGWGTCWLSPHRCRRYLTAGIRRARRARSWANRRARPRCP